jgi:EAL domain-containing protein (putative c-di-GMP-specific phosphodiesterase class I)
VKQVVRWQKALPRPQAPLFVSVNVSSSQLFRQDLLQQIRSILSRDAVPKKTLWLEVTESMVMENPEQAIEIMKLLKELGAGLSLDDFGTGFSSLNYLHRFPVDTIKIDKSFVRDAVRDGSTPVILRSIVAMSHELGKKVVAEGIESSADADYLRAIGCEFAQGFYFGEPMSEKGAMSLVSALAKAQKKQNSKQARMMRKAKKPPPGQAKQAARGPVVKERAGSRPAAPAAPLPAGRITSPRQA